MGDIILHVGMHKTGTTYLQKKIFNNFPDVDFCVGWSSIRTILNNFSNNDFPLLISDEEFSGKPFQKEYLNTYYSNIANINRIFRFPKIIIGFRGHSDFVTSLYKQYLQQGGYCRFNDFFNIENTGILKHEDILYKDRINFLKSSFTDIFIYTQEEILNNNDLVIKSMYRFITGKELAKFNFDEKKEKLNVSVNSTLQINILTKLNRIDHKLTKYTFLPSIYSDSPISKYLRKKRFPLTPRNISQNIFRNRGKYKFSIPIDIKEFIDDKYKNDWKYVMEHLG